SDGEPRIACLIRCETAESRREHVESAREYADELARMGSSRGAEAGCEGARGRRRRRETIEILDVTQDCTAIVGFPEAGFPCACKSLLFQHLARLDLFRNALELPPE